MPLILGLAVAAALNATPLDVEVGGAGYRNAFDRAQRYEGEAASDAWRANDFSPAVLTPMQALLKSCQAAGSDDDRVFTVVLSFDPDQDAPTLFLDRETPRGRCVTRGLSSLAYPAPPHPDFAEEIKFDFR